MNINRRSFIQRSTSLLSLISLSLITKLSFSKWPENLFNSDKYNEVITELLNGKETKEGYIKIKSPEIAERGEKVPVTISTDLENVKAISIIVDKNPRPFTSKFFISDDVEPYVSVHIKMKESSNIIAIVETDNKIYMDRKDVKVTTGGC